MSPHVTTFWHVATETPAQAFTVGASADPGFPRRLLSKLYPTATISSLGEFPLNRSASAGVGEIYIGAFPGLTVVQTAESDALRPSQIEDKWIALTGAPDVYSFAYDAENSVSAFAHWHEGKLVRSFSAAENRIVEDKGLPREFELPFWSGDKPQTSTDPLALPFDPAELLHAAHSFWLGFELSPEGLDVPVLGYATDGRREVRATHPPAGPAMHLTGESGQAEIADTASQAPEVDATVSGSPYSHDDYERSTLATTSEDAPAARSAWQKIRQAGAATGAMAAHGVRAARRRWSKK